MEFKNYEEITLDSNVLRNAREDFDFLLQKLFQKMEKNDSDEGSITLKVDINMITDFLPDREGNGDKTIKISKPVIRYKVTTSVPVKDSFDGKKVTGMKLVYDDELERYVLRHASEGGQRSIFDEDFQDIVNGTAKEIVNDVTALPDLACMPETGDGEEDPENGDFDGDNNEIEETKEEIDTDGAWGGTEVLEEDMDDYGYEE